MDASLTSEEGPNSQSNETSKEVRPETIQAIKVPNPFNNLVAFFLFAPLVESSILAISGRRAAGVSIISSFSLDTHYTTDFR